MPVSNTIAWTIRSCRLAHGYSQDYMADKLDISQSAYANLESGKTSMSIDRLIAVATILDLDMHKLIDADWQLTSEESIDRTTTDNTIKVYDQLVCELKNEIEFLRTLITQK